MKARCVECGSVLMGAFYMGLPGWACLEHDPPIAGGPGPWFAYKFGFVNCLVIYRPGDYWGTLWAWLTGRLEGPDDDEGN